MPTEQRAPTQYLILEVLAARHRLGETTWPFPTSVGPALLALQSAGLIDVLGSSEPKMVRARLTDDGRTAALTVGHVPANGGYDRLRQALEEIAAYAETRADLLIGMHSVANTARAALAGSGGR